MKRFGISAAASAAALLVCATATAGTTSYKGGFDPSGTLSFKIAKHHGKRWIPTHKFDFTALPLTCESGDRTTTGHTEVAIKVKEGRFQTTLFNNNKPFDATLKLHGKLEHHGRKAVGTMRIFGAEVAVDPHGNPAMNCDSGLVEWTAKRH